MSPARNKVLESWGLLRVICGGGRPLHIAKLALEGPRLHQLLDMSTQHLHQNVQSVMSLAKLQSMQSMVSFITIYMLTGSRACGFSAGQAHAIAFCNLEHMCLCPPPSSIKNSPFLVHCPSWGPTPVHSLSRQVEPPGMHKSLLGTNHAASENQSCMQALLTRHSQIVNTHSSQHALLRLHNS